MVPQYAIKQKEKVDAESAAVFSLRDTPHTHPSFHKYNVGKVMHDFKNTICHVSEQALDLKYGFFITSHSLAHQKPMKLYEFPNGFSTGFRGERFAIAECMFNPKCLKQEEGMQGLHHMLHASIQSCDPDIRSYLYQNIVVSGGNTLFPGFADRMNYEMSFLTPGIRPKVFASTSTTERVFSSWIGGSILASLGTFHQLWISKKEYEEFGASVIDRR